MVWRCPVCTVQAQGESCPRCQTPMTEGEPSAATGLFKETFGSVLFLIAVVCFTAALVFSLIMAWFPVDTIGMSDIKSAVTAFSDVTNTKMTPDAWRAINTLYRAVGTEATAGGELPIGGVLACIGLWLLLAQGYTERVNIRKGGPVLLKIVTVLGITAASIIAICGALLGVGLWLGRPELVTAFGEVDSDALTTAIHDLLACEATMWILLLLCAVLTVGGLLYLLFYIFADKTVNSLMFTAKTGEFGKKASAFVGVSLCVAAVGLAADAVASLLTANLTGIGSALYAVAFLLFAIVLFIFRHRAHTLLWEQPAFTGETAAAMPHLPAGLKAEDLLNDRPAMPPAAPRVAVPGTQNPIAPKRTLNEPFLEESLEPKPMTGNGCCPKCGTPIPDNAFFCLHCGHKFK